MNSDWFDVHLVRQGNVVIFQRIAGLVFATLESSLEMKLKMMGADSFWAFVFPSSWWVGAVRATSSSVSVILGVSHPWCQSSSVSVILGVSHPRCQSSSLTARYKC